MILVAGGVRFRLDETGVAHILFLERQAAENVAKDVEQDAKRRCPVDTGELEETIHRVGAQVHVGTEYWQHVEYGTAPHTIRSHGNYPLRSHETGEAFGREVHHPGTPAQPFMRPALYRKRVIRA